MKSDEKIQKKKKKRCGLTPSHKITAVLALA